jgi:hypothetical protein
MRPKLIPAIAAAVLLACQDVPQPVGPDTERANSQPEMQKSLASAVELTAEVEFGSDHVGSSFPPAQHDNSFHAFDRIRPHVVHILQGGRVTYEVYPCHRPAVYEPGITPDDIDTSLLEPIGVTGCPPDRINDPTGRLALAPPQSLIEADWTTPPGTFNEPGTYLVICTTFVHFQFAKMYAFVVVR